MIESGLRTTAGRAFFSPTIFALFFLSLLSACSTLPDRLLQTPSFKIAADSLFVSPLALQPTGAFSIEHPVDGSEATEFACVAIFKNFLESDCGRLGQVVLFPVVADSLAQASFGCPMDADAWRALYGSAPGSNARVLQIESMTLHGIKTPFWKSFLDGLNLLDRTGREWGWVDTRYRLFDFTSECGSGLRTHITRLADTPWAARRQDRAAQLMRQAARELSQSLR
jgi:hypothetical protein